MDQLKKIGENSQSLSQVVQVSRGTKKIAEYGAEKIDQLRNRIVTIGYLMGINKAPEPEQMDAIVSFLVNNYKDLSMEEIGLSFELAAAGKLDTSVEHYNNFNIPYLGRILNAYRDHRNKEIQYHKRNEIVSENTVKLTPEQHYNWVVKYVKEHRSVPFTADWGSVFTHMENVQQGPDNTQKQAFKKKMEGQLKQEGKMNLSGQDIKLGKEIFAILNTPSTLQSYCREQWVKQFMNQLIEDESK